MKKIFVGKVISDKVAGMAIVLVATKKRHPIYHKVITKNKKFYADNKIGAKLDDLVKIEESRPLSKTKRFIVLKILKESK